MLRRMTAAPPRDEGLRIDTLGGTCPVQAEGTVDGHAFYFRARGSYWSMSIGGKDVIGEPEWYYDEAYEPSAAVTEMCRFRDFAAGYLTDHEARMFIIQAAAKFRAERDAACAALLERTA